MPRAGPTSLDSPAEVAAASGDDPIPAWAAQSFGPGVRAWALGDAVAVASAGLSCRDRLAVVGPPAEAVELVRHALAEVGPTYRPIGPVELIRVVADRVGGLRFGSAFGWMGTADPPPGAAAGAGAARWLAQDELDEVARLLERDFPDSHARPGVPGVRRWAGVRDPAGRLVASAADAWSAPGVGFVAGVATAAPARRRGHAAAACALVVSDLLADHGRVALMVDAGNDAAVRLYERLGLRHRSIATAWPDRMASRPSG